MFFIFQELTEALTDHFEIEHSLGIDVDEDLIKAACVKVNRKQIDFKTCDIITNSKFIEDYLQGQDFDQFDVIFCFSVSMWIHLNHGENGLKHLFRQCKRLCKGLFLLEPQPWKCYMTAARRMRKLNQPKFDHLDLIKQEHRQENLLPYITGLCENEGFKLISTMGETHWKRPIMLFKNE